MQAIQRLSMYVFLSDCVNFLNTFDDKSVWKSILMTNECHYIFYFVFQAKRRKYNKSTLHFTAKSERYKDNKFIQNPKEEQNKPNDTKFNFYIRPFIPFWRVQQLNFEIINAFDEIPKINEKTYPRYVLHDLVQTWIAKDPVDKCWFDREDIYNSLKDDLILRIQSQLPTKTLRKIIFHHSPILSIVNSIFLLLCFFRFFLSANVDRLPEFELRRHLILDCWLLYQYKSFQGDEKSVSFDYFPMWNSTKEVRSLVYEKKFHRTKFLVNVLV